MTIPVSPAGRPFRWLFLDLNAYFASVEQNENPELRGKPVAVVQVESANSCVIAASYEAKRFGVATASLVSDARRLCPDLILVRADHGRYVDYHDRIVEAVETVVPVDKALSIDEMRVRLLGEEATADGAVAVARKVKDAIYDLVGESLACSIGLAPNAFLAKIATELEKPNGLVLLPADEAPARLADWKLTHLPGINKRMAVRLNLGGIYTMPQLFEATERELREAFGSVIGARWWHHLRGADLPDLGTKRSGLSHEHVLPPQFRTRDGSYGVLLRLTEKAAARLRKEGFAARTISFHVRGRKDRWESSVRLGATRDTLLLIETLRREWERNAIEDPTKVGVALSDLVSGAQLSLSLFDEDNCRDRLALAVDGMNRRFGKHSILPAGVLGAKDTAPERIAFQKTSLFDEGGGRAA